MALQRLRANGVQRGGVVAGSSAVMFSAAALSEGVFSSVMLVAGALTLAGAVALLASAYFGGTD